MACLVWAALVLAQVLCLGGQRWAGAAESGSPGLTELARLAKDAFRPISESRVAAARDRARKAVQPLEAYFNGGTKENAERWKAYLYWDRMVAELAKDAGPDVKTLGAVALRYYREQRGMELVQFTEMRDALVNYANVAEMASIAQLEALYQNKLDDLIGWLPQYEKEFDPTVGDQIAQAIAWLERAGQAASLVAGVRKAYGRPNLHAELSEGFINAGVADDVEDARVVEDCILGTFLVEDTQTKGRTSLRLVERKDAAEVELRLTGIISSNNVGYNRGVKVYSRGQTTIDASKRIVLRPAGVATKASRAHCTTHSTIDRICAKSGLVVKIAWRKAMQDKGQAEQIASRHAEERVQKRIDEMAKEYLVDARREYAEKFRKPLLQRGEFPRDLKYRCAKGAFEVVWLQANAGQLAAPEAPPNVEVKHDVAVRVHESFVSNFSRAALARRTLSDEDLARILQEWSLEVPEELKIDEYKDPWSMEFDGTRPVSASFRDGTVRLAVRGRRFTFKDNDVRRPMELSATYQYALTEDGIRFTRQGDVVGEYVGGGDPNNVEVAIRAVMIRKFEALFRPEVTTSGFLLPGRWKDVGKLMPKKLEARDGWITFAWLRASEQ
jgi:hypothetical protein